MPGYPSQWSGRNKLKKRVMTTLVPALQKMRTTTLHDSCWHICLKNVLAMNYFAWFYRSQIVRNGYYISGFNVPSFKIWSGHQHLPDLNLAGSWINHESIINVHWDPQTLISQLLYFENDVMMDLTHPSNLTLPLIVLYNITENFHS